MHWLLAEGGGLISFIPFTAKGRIIRRENDHPGGQGRIYTSHHNFLSTHLSKPGHRRGCCCMSPRCLIGEVRWSLLALLGLFHWENSSSMLRVVFVQMAGNSVVAIWMFPEATSWYELYVWWLSLRRWSRRELVSSCWKRGRRMTVDICWERKLVTWVPGGK